MKRANDGLLQMGMKPLTETGSRMVKWAPLTGLVILALAFEPLRSGLVLANQPCEFLTDWETVKSSLHNRRHIIGYGLICLVAAMTFRENRIAKAAIATFLFSVFLEIEQKFFSTGHCRLWDLIPNLLGITLAVGLFALGVWCKNRFQQLNTGD